MAAPLTALPASAAPSPQLSPLQTPASSKPASPKASVTLAISPNSQPVTPAGSAPATPTAAGTHRAAVAALPASTHAPGGTLIFRGQTPRRVAAMHRGSNSDADEDMISTELHERLVCHERCCTAVMCCVFCGFFAFIAYHEGVSAGQREVAPRCQYDLNNCRLALMNLTKTYKKN